MTTSQNLVELSRCQDIDPFERLDIEKVLIAGDDVIGVSGDSGFEELVIVGVGVYDAEIWVWIDKLRVVSECFDFLLDFRLVQTEPSGYFCNVLRNSVSVGTETTIWYSPLYPATRTSWGVPVAITPEMRTIVSRTTLMDRSRVPRELTG